MSSYCHAAVNVQPITRKDILSGVLKAILAFIPIDAMLIAGKALRALALKAAAEASVAASVPPLSARVRQHSAVSQSAVSLNTDEVAMRQAEELGRFLLASSSWTRAVI